MIWEIEDGPRVIEGLDHRGRPRPEYAAALGLVPAPIGRRMLATVIEALAVGLLQLPMLIFGLPAILSAVGQPDPVAAFLARPGVGWVIASLVVPYAATTVFLLVQLILLGRRGVTLGKAFVGIRMVNVKTLERPTFWRGAVVRYLIQVASFALPLLGPLLVIALSPLFDSQRRRRGWPDRAAATYLVDIRRGLNPYDAKRMRIARKTVATDLRDEKTSLPSLATPASGPATDVYIPVARKSGGVVGAPKDRRPAGAADAADDHRAAPIQGAPFAVESPAEAAAPSREPVVVADAASPRPSAATSAPASAETLLPAAHGAWSPPELMTAAERSGSLQLDSGDELTIPAGGAVLGRAPSTTGADAGALAVPIVDPTKSISKTHLALRWAEGALAAVDLGSTNGSAIIRDGREIDLAPGSPAELRSGDTLRFGDRHASVRLP